MQNNTVGLPWWKNPKIVSLLVFFILVLVLPVIIWEVGQQQAIRQHAAFIAEPQDSCGNIGVAIIDNPSCPGGVLASLQSYSAKATLTNKTKNSIVINATWDTYWCASRSDLSGANAQCLKNPVPQQKDYNLGPYSTIFITSPVRKPLSPYNTCGYYQTDFSFYYDGGRCTYGARPGQGTVWGATYCNNGFSCTVPKVTPTNTPTPTKGPTPTNTPTPSITDTPTVTPTLPVTPTDTPQPSATPTSTPTPTPGPTGVDLPPTCTSLTADRATTGTAPFALTFTGSGNDPDGTISKATFTFGDGTSPQDVFTGGGLGTQTVNVQLSHSYANVGSYTATVTFTDNASLQSIAAASCSLNITVTTPPTSPPGNPPIYNATPTPIYYAAQPTTPPQKPLPPTGPADLFKVGIIGTVLSAFGGLLLIAL